MIKKIILLLLCVILMTSCAFWHDMRSVDAQMRKLDIDMTKNEVVSIMGSEYEVINRKEHTFTLGYKSIDDGIYMLFFEDGLLKEWNKEWIIDRYKVDHSISTSTSSK